MNKEELKVIVCQSSSDYETLDNIYDYIEKLEAENQQLQQKVNQLETNRDELKKWLEENRKWYIYQDELGDDWYFEDLYVFDELKNSLERVEE